MTEKWSNNKNVSSVCARLLLTIFYKYALPSGKEQTNFKQITYGDHDEDTQFDGTHNQFDGTYNQFDGTHNQYDGTHDQYDGSQYDGNHGTQQQGPTYGTPSTEPGRSIDAQRLAGFDILEQMFDKWVTLYLFIY